MLLRAVLSRAVGSRCGVWTSSETATYNADGGPSRIQQQQLSRCQTNVRHRSAGSSRTRHDGSSVGSSTTSLDENGNPIEPLRIEDDNGDHSISRGLQQQQPAFISADNGRGLKPDNSSRCQPFISDAVADASSFEIADLKTERCRLDLDDDDVGNSSMDVVNNGKSVVVDIQTSSRVELSTSYSSNGVTRGKMSAAATGGAIIRTRRKRSSRKKGRNQSHPSIDVEQTATQSVGDGDVSGMTEVPSEQCVLQQQRTSPVVVVVPDVDINAYASAPKGLDAVADATDDVENASSQAGDENISDELEDRDSSNRIITSSRQSSIDTVYGANCRSSRNVQRARAATRQLTDVGCHDTSSCQQLTRADSSESRSNVLTNGHSSEFDASIVSSSSSSPARNSQRGQHATPDGKPPSDSATNADCDTWRVAKPRSRTSRRQPRSPQLIDDRKTATTATSDGRRLVVNASKAGAERSRTNCRNQRVPFDGEAARVFLYEAYQEVLKTSSRYNGHRLVVFYSDGVSNASSEQTVRPQAGAQCN